MNILLDMNLSPSWTKVLEENGHHAVHWSTIGALNAPDSDLLKWAHAYDFIIFTHDLDFGALLAASNANSPSVIQLRMQDISPEATSSLILQLLKDQSEVIKSGALLSVDGDRNRIRILPMNRE